jgi:uncharacterized membrane protein
MSEHHDTAPANAEATATLHPSDFATVRSRARASLRVPLIWILSALSLLPGVTAAIARGFWGGLPDAFRFTTYALAGVMILAAVALIVTHKE